MPKNLSSIYIFALKYDHLVELKVQRIYLYAKDAFGHGWFDVHSYDLTDDNWGE